ncbi:MAG: exodeoxyribonuclease VII large subunit [Alphaproteobacteria bacterium]|nr:exodeoxyribonuclease VII large subunit [Alphaproteobacteria bacterium]
MTAPRANLPEFSVSEIATALKRTVEDAFPFVRVRGEISGLKFHSSGHVYFDLKDDKAVLNAVIWRGTAQRLKIKPEQGLEVVCTGRISTYAGSSRYQIIVEQVELAGLGALMAMLEERKKRLAAEGLFASERKKPLPFLPNVIGVITSPTGAVIRDIMHRLNDRFPRRVLLWPVAVQGERAADEVTAAIRGFNALRPGGALPVPDVLIVARGGGSVEDLMVFNEENVVRAVAESRIPVISAVGHETDTTLIDFVSDRRAPTPTAAAEMAVPVRADLIAQTLDCQRRAFRAFSRAMAERRSALTALARVLPRADQLFAQPRQRLDGASERLINGLRGNLHVHRTRFLKSASVLRPQPLSRHIVVCGERLTGLEGRLALAHRGHLAVAARRIESLSRILQSVSYRAVLSRGFALVRGGEGALKRAAAAVSSGETLQLTFADGTVGATADGTPVKSPPPKSLSRRRAGGSQGSLF